MPLWHLTVTEGAKPLPHFLARRVWNGIFVAEDRRAKRDLMTMSPCRDRKSETPRKGRFCGHSQRDCARTEHANQWRCPYLHHGRKFCDRTRLLRTTIAVYGPYDRGRHSEHLLLCLRPDGLRHSFAGRGVCWPTIPPGLCRITSPLFSCARTCRCR